mgnify:CR=1 FL=1
MLPHFRLKAASQQTLANPHLQRGGAQQITAAHDIINTHIEVIHDHDQLIAEQSIGSANHGIAYLAGQIVVLWTIDTVVKACDTINDSGIALLFRRHGSRQRSGIVRHCTLLFLPLPIPAWRYGWNAGRREPNGHGPRRDGRAAGGGTCRGTP